MMIVIQMTTQLSKSKRQSSFQTEGEQEAVFSIRNQQQQRKDKIIKGFGIVLRELGYRDYASILRNLSTQTGKLNLDPVNHIKQAKQVMDRMIDLGLPANIASRLDLRERLGEMLIIFLKIKNEF